MHGIFSMSILAKLSANMLVKYKLTIVSCEASHLVSETKPVYDRNQFRPYHLYQQMSQNMSARHALHIYVLSGEHTFR